MNNVIALYPYEVHEFSWGSAVKKRNGEWEKVFIRPNAQEIDVTGIKIILHENGMEFESR